MQISNGVWNIAPRMVQMQCQNTLNAVPNVKLCNGTKMSIEYNKPDHMVFLIVVYKRQEREMIQMRKLVCGNALTSIMSVDQTIEDSTITLHGSIAEFLLTPQKFTFNAMEASLLVAQWRIRTKPKYRYSWVQTGILPDLVIKDQKCAPEYRSDSSIDKWCPIRERQRKSVVYNHIFIRRQSPSNNATIRNREWSVGSVGKQIRR